MTEDEISQLQAENDRLRQQINEANQAKNAEFVEDLIEQGNLAPVVKAQAVELLNFASQSDNGETLDFNEGESLLQKMQAFLKAQPKIVEFAEIATKDKASETGEFDSVSYAENTPPELIELDQKIRAYAQQHGVDYRTAFSTITQQGA